MVVINMDPGYHARMHSILEEIQASEVFSALVSSLVGEVVHYSWIDSTAGDDENRVAYLSEKHKDAIRLLGTRAHEMGGFDLMQFVCEAARPMMKGPCDARTLEFAWDGIGEWRA